jgi:Zn-dependent metalloprotease
MGPEQHHRHSILCILPPHLLEAIMKNGTDAQRAMAEQMLRRAEEMRTVRAAAHAELRALPPAAAMGAPHKQRSVFDAAHTEKIPGVRARAEGQGPTGDAAVDEAYDGLGATFDLYWDTCRRNSVDGAGMELDATVHYGTDYDNAYWNGEQMIFGDGDGRLFNRFTIAVDVIGHELTHGVTGHTANLDYNGQSGALNESLSDVFGSMVKQYAAVPRQSAAQADWLIGAGLLRPGVKGVALRSMKAPGTAYDDPLLGKDPQPAHMRDYVTTNADDGGVHINSGIPNKAFATLAVSLGGYSWEKAGQIWYRTLTDARLAPASQFMDFAYLTVLNALQLHGNEGKRAATAAWSQVGIDVP